MSSIFYCPSFKLASHSLSYFLLFNVCPFPFIIPHPLFHLPLSVPPVMRKCTISLHGNSNWLPRWTSLWPGSKQTKEKKKRDTRRSITDKLSLDLMRILMRRQMKKSLCSLFLSLPHKRAVKEQRWRLIKLVTLHIRCAVCVIGGEEGQRLPECRNTSVTVALYCLSSPLISAHWVFKHVTARDREILRDRDSFTLCDWPL